MKKRIKKQKSDYNDKLTERQKFYITFIIMFIISGILTTTVANILEDSFFQGTHQILYELSIIFLVTVYLMLAYYGIFRAYVYAALLIIILTNIISFNCGSWSCKAVLLYPVIFTISALILAPIIYLIGFFHKTFIQKQV